jgi:hypothetical protein
MATVGAEISPDWYSPGLVQSDLPAGLEWTSSDRSGPPTGQISNAKIVLRTNSVRSGPVRSRPVQSFLPYGLDRTDPNLDWVRTYCWRHCTYIPV